MHCGLLHAVVLVLALSSSIGLRAAAETQFEARILWPQGRGIGGVSGLLVSPDGMEILALSDRGEIIAADLIRDSAGRLQSLGAVTRAALAPPPQASWPRDDFHFDSEGLALLPDGQVVVAYEGLHRVSLHAASGAFHRWIAIPDIFAELEVNAGLEAVAVDGAGRILAIPEAWSAQPDQRPVFAYDATHHDADWQILTRLLATPGFDPVGADIDEQGRLYLLERRFRQVSGFQARLRRFDLSAPGPLEGEVLLHTGWGRHGNLEGLALWRRGDGALMALLVADDNFSPFLPGEIVEYQLAE